MKTYKITYHMHPYPDIEVLFTGTEEEAIIFAKSYRKDAFSLCEVDTGAADCTPGKETE